MPTERFLQYLQHEKRFSPHTVSAYQSDLLQFTDFLATEYDHQDLATVTPVLVRSWLASLMEQELSPNSVNRKITTLKTFYRFLKREGNLERDPMAKVVAPKKVKRLPVFVEEKSMAVLLDELEFTDDFAGVRDRIILDLFYSTGIRLAELIALKADAVDFHTRTLKVMGKRNKERIVPFGQLLADGLRAYLALRTQIVQAGVSELIVTGKGQKVYPKLVYRVVNGYLSKVTTSEKKSPHVLRHTFATHMLNNGADLNAIKELLGHADLSATQVYTHNTFEKLKNIYKDAHPRA